MSLEYKKKLTKLLIELNDNINQVISEIDYENKIELIVDELIEQIGEGDK